jgi:hypothetical protein
VRKYNPARAPPEAGQDNALHRSVCNVSRQEFPGMLELVTRTCASLATAHTNKFASRVNSNVPAAPHSFCWGGGEGANPDADYLH